MKTAMGYSGCVTAPHRLAAKSGVDVLAAGGNAIEAMIAAAATIAVVYPHMNSIGGDGFWIIRKPGEAPIAIEACGQAAKLATRDWYRERGHEGAIPTRGAHAALTVPGTIGGWQKALEMAGDGRRLSLSDLLADAIGHARNGIAVTQNQFDCTDQKLDGLRNVPGFAGIYLRDNAPLTTGSKLRQTALADTLESLAREGLESYYLGDIAQAHDRFWREQDSPLRREDLEAYRCVVTQPLKVKTSLGTLYNTNPPTQGISSLMILAIFDRLGVKSADGFDHLHGIIEATKQAFIVRNRELGDRSSMRIDPQELLADSHITALAEAIDMKRALSWPHVARDGDTIWMGACDRDGTMVSFIQSVYWEFGSGLTCPETGVFFQNRGAGFSMQEGPNCLAPGKKPFHTLNPALAELNDGRTLVYGTMGGEGQPQTQAALFTRYAAFGRDLQDCISAPRWLLGRTWGDDTTTLKIERGLDPELVQQLRDAGHEVELVAPVNDIMGHAGAIAGHADGLIEGANDPRSDGLALAF
ncbi:MAG: gamma-glutamyltransferase family protein [Nitratireductor sp.]|nr:gamma-glutamyltransferase family protein [Nitratireductor sp.]MCC0020022.1 gamma-glutamyltransferase family protein [Nitratireductor sp.]